MAKLSGKEKKLLRKAEAGKARELQTLIKELKESPDPLAPFAALSKYECRGQDLEIRACTAATLPPGALDWAFGLTQAHMAHHYETCAGWEGGWSDRKKRAELAHEDARYLVVLQQQQQGATPAAAAEERQGEPPVAAAPEAVAPAPAGGGDENVAPPGAGGAELVAACAAESKPVAFLHYRVEEEEGEPVLYVYEIQVESAAQGGGLGRRLMQLAELVAARGGLVRLMLTVFHANEAARAMYRRLGYTPDPDSPGLADPEGEYGYEILTKRLPARGPAAPAK